MKKFYLLSFLIAILFHPVTPLLAKDKQNILISGEGLPYIMVASIQNDASMDMYLIPADLSLPQSNAPQQAKALASYDKQKDMKEIQSLLQQYFHLPIHNHVFLHMDAIQKDMGVAYDDKTFSDMKHMTGYFSKVAKQLKVSMIFHASDYLEDDLRVNDYYSLYKLFHDGHPKIRYHYVNYYYVDETVCYPLNYQFT